MKYLHQSNNIVWFHCHEISELTKLTGAESLVRSPRDWAKGKGAAAGPWIEDSSQDWLHYFNSHSQHLTVHWKCGEEWNSHIILIHYNSSVMQISLNCILSCLGSSQYFRNYSELLKKIIGMNHTLDICNSHKSGLFWNLLKYVCEIHT